MFGKLGWLAKTALNHSVNLVNQFNSGQSDDSFGAQSALFESIFHQIYIYPDEQISLSRTETWPPSAYFSLAAATLF